MSENLSKKPKRGILKQSTSFEQRDLEPHPHPKNPHFDEQNILETLHPADKDYGFMKIDEPKTPYEYNSSASQDDEEQENDTSELDAHQLAARISQEAAGATRMRRRSEPSADEEDLKLLSPEEREKRNKFEQKRKKHYNEFYAVKMARQLMDKDGEELDEDQEQEDETKSDAMEISTNK